MAKGAAAREAVIGRTARVRGRITGEGDLTVEGRVEGDISVRGDLTVAESGTLESNIDADAVSISGSLEGDVRARGVIRIESGARVRGDMHGSTVAIEEGAEYTGRLDSTFDLPAELSDLGKASSSTGASSRDKRR